MKRIYLLVTALALMLSARADFLLVPMDAQQMNHLKAYGVAYQSLKSENKVQWLLNYRGGAFLMKANEVNESLLKSAGVSYERLSDVATQEVVNTVLLASNKMNMVSMDHTPSIAVYAPSLARPYDDAVTMALTYAGISYTTIYDREVMSTDLSKYDWIHLHHEDFTGQYNKWGYLYNSAQWYKDDKSQTETTAKEFGLGSASALKLAVAKKIRTFVENGGQLFAMCTGTDKLDIALAADGVDIIPASIDGTPADARANEKLNFNRTFAFQNFTVDTADKMKEYSTISIPNTSKAAKDKFNLVAIDAKKDLSLAMLVQNHESSIKEFKGSTTAFNRGTIKPSVSILGGTATDAKYLHGIRGAGAFTFYAGHDPEDFEHLVGDKATDLNSYKQSAGYRLILNNILLQTVTAKMLGVSDISSINVQVSPNPIINSYTIELQGEDTKQVKLTIYNLNGQVVVKEEIHNELGNYKKTFDSSTYASGLYVVEVSNNKGVIGKKLISKAGL